MMRRVKEVFDPHTIFNPGKIIDTPPMDTFAASFAGARRSWNIRRSSISAPRRASWARRKNAPGVGDCRKIHSLGGHDVPELHGDPRMSRTRRRRGPTCCAMYCTHPQDVTNPWDSEEVKAVMDLCLSCKGCKSECPSNVDVARLKAEWQQHYYDTNGVPLALAAHRGFHPIHAPGRRSRRRFYNLAVTTPAVSRTWIKKLVRLRASPQHADAALHHPRGLACARHANKAGG